MDLGLGQNGYRGVGPDLPGRLSEGHSADHSQTAEVSVELSSDAALCQTLTSGPSSDLTPGVTLGVSAESLPAPASRLTLSPNPSPSPPVRERGTSNPLEMIAAGCHSVEAICRASGASILELAAHVCTAQNLEALARVKLLHATQREMLLGRLRPRVLARLSELTEEVGAANPTEVRACEVMRKACVDILRAGNGAAHAESRRSGFDGGGPRSNSHRRESITPASEAEVLEALERWGREEEEQEEEVYPQITQIAQMGLGGFESKSGNGAGWSKAEPQATPEGDVEREVEVTREAQVGMAFGKTSDHGTESMRPCTRRVLPVQERPLRTGKMPMPPLVETTRRGCQGPVPPPRDDCDRGSLSPCPHGQVSKTQLVHATRSPLHQPRPPPTPDPPTSANRRSAGAERLGQPLCG